MKQLSCGQTAKFRPSNQAQQSKAPKKANGPMLTLWGLDTLAKFIQLGIVVPSQSSKEEKRLLLPLSFCNPHTSMCQRDRPETQVPFVGKTKTEFNST